MRILHVITGLGKGGAETMLYRLLSHGRDVGMKHRVVSLTSGGYYRDMIIALGVPVLECGLKNLQHAPRSLLRLIALVRRYRPHIIQAWMYHANLFSLLLPILVPHTRLIWNIRHSLHHLAAEKFMTRLIIRLNRIFSGRCAAIIFNSARSALQHAEYGFQSRGIRVIPNGFDTDTFSPDSRARDRVRHRLAIANSCALIGAVGRYHPLKDYPGLIKAAALLRDLKPVSDWRLLIVGRNVDTSRELTAVIDKFRLSSHVIRLGQQHNIQEHMNACDIFCLSSSSEAFPNVLGEAMACGVPCVSTDVGDAADIIGDTGIVVPPRDPAALSGALQTMLRRSSRERTALGRAARERVQCAYGIETIAERYRILYRELSSGNA